MYGSRLACPAMPKKRNCARKGRLAPVFLQAPAPAAMSNAAM